MESSQRLALKQGKENKVKRRLKAVVIALGVIAGFGAFAHTPAGADTLGTLLKIAGIGVVIDKFGPDINEAINKLTASDKNLALNEATKVVPILSLGSGTHLGACQVTGSKAKLDMTKAVVQVEGKFSVVRLKALVPVDGTKNLSSVKRVNGVAVTALVDMKL